MNPEDLLEQGREAFRQQNWAEAYTLLISADHDKTLPPPDLEQLAKAAYLAGKESVCTDCWSRAHHEYLSRQKINEAVRCAFWIGMIFFNHGDHAQGGGWIARAERILDDYREKGPEQGFLLVPKALQQLREGAPEKAYELFDQASQLGVRFNNPDLATLGRLGRGQALIHQNNIKEGVELFDEAMVSVVSDEVSPIVAGIVYCAVIDTCKKIYDWKRAREWTKALTRWCASQPGLVPYRGQCLVRRAEIMQLHGKWTEAMKEVQLACETLQDSSPPATGEAYYRQGELYRLRGNFFNAEESYRQAHQWGRNPQPGFALLRLAQGQIDAAEAAIRPIEKEKQDPISRSGILPAYIEIMLAADNSEEAQAAAVELSDIAKDLDAPFLNAISNRARGIVLLSTGKPGAALIKLRLAWTLFNRLEASYETACTQLYIGLASRKLGDNDTAEIELEAAKATFGQLGATADIKKVNSLIRQNSSGDLHGLTPREFEVLRLLVTGQTNKAIAAKLYISERTVDRHVSNILSKLNVPSRAAATAYAYKHDLM